MLASECPRRGPETREQLVTTSTDTELEELYTAFAAADMMPLWTQRDDLMTDVPHPHAVPTLWRWSTLYPLAEPAGELVPVGRGGERRAMALANPGLPGTPYATPTLWAAIQYLGPEETAPAHRHTQTAFRFVVEGDGVWTNVEGDAVAMGRGDLLLTPSWHFHEHHNTTDHPMAWIDGLDIPLVSQLDAGFFEFGPDELGIRATPAISRGERLWAHPGLRPVTAADRAVSPLMAYRWEHTDAALRAQLELKAEGHPETVEPGHAAIRFSSATSRSTKRSGSTAPNEETPDETRYRTHRDGQRRRPGRRGHRRRAGSPGCRRAAGATGLARPCPGRDGREPCRRRPRPGTRGSCAGEHPGDGP